MNESGTTEQQGQKDIVPERVTKVVKTIGHVTSTVTTCIRALTLNNAYDAPRGGLDEMSYFELSRYLKAPSVKIPFYFAAQQRMSDAQKSQSAIGPAQIIEVFNAHELASMLAITYLYKRVRGRIKENEDWQRISKSVEEQLTIGALMGEALPSIGLGTGTLIGGIRPLALGLFFLVDPKGYKDYRRDLKIKGATYNLKEEAERWGITHLDVACRLLIQLGFGQQLATDFYNGIGSESDQRLTDEQLRLRLTGCWIEAFTAGSSPPSVRGEEKHQASSDTLDMLVDSCATVRGNGDRECWVNKGKKDVSKSTHPALFAAADLNDHEGDDDIELHAD